MCLASLPTMYSCCMRRNWAYVISDHRQDLIIVSVFFYSWIYFGNIWYLCEGVKSVYRLNGAQGEFFTVCKRDQYQIAYLGLFCQFWFNNLVLFQQNKRFCQIFIQVLLLKTYGCKNFPIFWICSTLSIHSITRWESPFAPPPGRHPCIVVFRLLFSTSSTPQHTSPHSPHPHNACTYHILYNCMNASVKLMCMHYYIIHTSTWFACLYRPTSTKYTNTFYLCRVIPEYSYAL